MKDCLFLRLQPVPAASLAVLVQAQGQESPSGGAEGLSLCHYHCSLWTSRLTRTEPWT